MKICAFLPAKGSSERVINKNIKLLNGKPLFLHSLEKLCQIELISDVYLDTECINIINLASETPCKVIHRPQDLASNKTNGNDLMNFEASQIDADIYVQLLGTSPFITVETIISAIEMVISKENDYDSVTLVSKEKQYQWYTNNMPAYNIDNIPNSFDLEDVICETMGLYVITKEALKRTKRRIGNTPCLIEASKIEAIDVNTDDDFKLAHYISIGQQQQENRNIQSLKHHASSALLSDIMDDMGYSNQIVNGLSCNLPNKKIFGRAKTLKLRALKDGEDFKGIYKALDTYPTLSDHNIIVVENELPEYAYFGELNACLAMRSGASGAIINGNTRDYDAVEKFGLPVFSKGLNCQDVRKRATVESINKTICLNGVNCPSDSLIFADNDGIVVIPKKIEKKVLTLMLERSETEFRISLDIASGFHAQEINKKFGDF